MKGLFMNNLVDFLTPPKLPFEVPTQAEWAIAEAQLGTQLPDDYKNFISAYGTGAIQDYFIIYNPISEVRVSNLFQNLQRVYGHHKAFVDEFRSELPEDFPFSIYPEKEDFLLLGNTTNGDNIFWERNSTPNQWTILVVEARSYRFERYDLGIKKFLLNFLNRTINSDILSLNFFHEPIFFKQYQPKSS
jgi:hypothetical protein